MIAAGLWCVVLIGGVTLPDSIHADPYAPGDPFRSVLLVPATPPATPAAAQPAIPRGIPPVGVGQAPAGGFGGNAVLPRANAQPNPRAAVGAAAAVPPGPAAPAQPPLRQNAPAAGAGQAAGGGFGGNALLPGANVQPNAQAAGQAAGIGFGGNVLLPRANVQPNPQPAAGAGAAPQGFQRQAPVQGPTAIPWQPGGFVPPFGAAQASRPSAARIGTGVGPAPTAAIPDKPFSDYHPVPTTVNPLYYLMRPDSAFSPLSHGAFYSARYDSYRLVSPIVQQQQQSLRLQRQVRDLRSETQTQQRTIQQLQQRQQELLPGGPGSGPKPAGYLDYYDYYPGLRQR